MRNQKGVIDILVIFLVLILFATAGYLFINNESNDSVEQNQQTVSIPTNPIIPTRYPGELVENSECENDNLGIKITPPKDWECRINAESTSQYNIELVKSDGLKIVFADIYPYDGSIPQYSYDSRFSNIEVNGIEYGIHYNTDTPLPNIFEPIEYEGDVLFYVYGYIPQQSPLPQEDLDEIDQILSTFQFTERTQSFRSSALQNEGG